MPGPNCAEVPQIERRHLGDLEPFGDSKDRRIHSPQRKVRILANQLGHSEQVSSGEFDEFDLLVGDRFQESGLGLRAYAGFHEVANFREDGLGTRTGPG